MPTPIWVTGTLVLLLVFSVFLPFLPGSFDPLAIPVSYAAQLSILAGLLLLPFSLSWLVYEIVSSKAIRSGGDESLQQQRRVWFVVTTIAAAIVFGAVCALVIYLAISPTLGLVAFSCMSVSTLWLWKRRHNLKSISSRSFKQIPMHLVAVPIALLLIQALLLRQFSEAARQRVIANAARFIEDIEGFKAKYGMYPGSLIAQWKDYEPGILGIDGFRYHRHGDAYSLSFEQPKLLVDQTGTREWVVYNPLDQHQMHSHVSFFLLLSPEEHERNPGWHAVTPLSNAHWKVFSFD